MKIPRLLRLTWAAQRSEMSSCVSTRYPLSSRLDSIESSEAKRLGVKNRFRARLPSVLCAGGRDGRIFALWRSKTQSIVRHQGSSSQLARLSAEKTMKRKLKTGRSRGHEVATVESFRNDPAFAAEYLNAILEDGDQEELMLALRRISEAFGGVQKLVRNARLNANTLYRTLSFERQSGIEEPTSGSPGDGHAAHGPSTAKKGSLSYDSGEFPSARNIPRPAARTLSSRSTSRFRFPKLSRLLQRKYTIIP